MAVKQQHTAWWIYVLSMWLLAGGLVLADNVPKPLKISSYTLQSVNSVGGASFDFIYKAKLSNNTTSVAVAVTAILRPPKKNKFTIIDGNLSFGDVPAMGTIPSSDTFTIRRNKRKAISKDDLNEVLKWQITTGSGQVNTPPVA